MGFRRREQATKSRKTTTRLTLWEKVKGRSEQIREHRFKLILEMKLDQGLTCKIDIRQFIGRGGASFRQL